MIDEAQIRTHYELTRPSLDERGRRRYAAAQVRALGPGSLSAVSRATGIARSTIGRGLKELDAKSGETEFSGVRRKGGGRKPKETEDPTILQDLQRLVDPVTRGDPEGPLRWVSRSRKKLAKALQEMGYQVCANTVGRLLIALGFSRQANRKTREGTDHPDRDAQFEHINSTAKQFHEINSPVISVDTKKKELIGNFKNPGTDYEKKKSPQQVDVHDFPDEELGKVIPYGVYDLAQNSGWVSVGVNHDTGEFAVNAIRTWHDKMGRDRYPDTKSLMITADCGGSNGYRNRLWKAELQRLSDDIGLTITVCHFPPGTSKWNKIEHRLFSFITQNWRGRPLVSRMAVVELIAATTTTKGLKVGCELDTNNYQNGRKISDAEMHTLNIQRQDFHPEWNYTVRPRPPS